MTTGQGAPPTADEMRRRKHCERVKAEYARRKAAGMCCSSGCPVDPVPGTHYCPRHTEERRAYARRYYHLKKNGLAPLRQSATPQAAVVATVVIAAGDLKQAVEAYLAATVFRAPVTATDLRGEIVASVRTTAPAGS